MAPRFEKVGVLVEPQMHRNAPTLYRIRVLGRYGLQVFAEASRTRKEVEAIHEYLAKTFHPDQVPNPPQRESYAFKWTRVSKMSINIRKYCSALLRSREIMSDPEVLRFFGTKSLEVQNNAAKALGSETPRSSVNSTSSGTPAQTPRANRRASMPTQGYARTFSDPSMSRCQSTLVTTEGGGVEVEDKAEEVKARIVDYVNVESIQEDLARAAIEVTKPKLRRERLLKACSESALTPQGSDLMEIHESLSLWPQTQDA